MCKQMNISSKEVSNSYLDREIVLCMLELVSRLLADFRETGVNQSVVTIARINPPNKRPIINVE